MKNSLLIGCLLLVGEFLFINQVQCEAFTKALCSKQAKAIDTIAGYLEFLDRLVPENGKPLEEQQNAIINACLHSVNGQQDATTLRGLIRDASEVHSVCEPNFMNRLLQFDRQIKENVSHSKYLKRKQKHRFVKFFGLFAGQVALTCKKSLAKKLQLAEENHEAAVAIERILRLSSKNDVSLDETKAKNLSVLTRKMLKVIENNRPNIVTDVENLVLIDIFKPSPDVVLKTYITINSAVMLDEFTKTKEACQLIDQYAHSSIYPVTKLAWRGYLAQNDVDTVDISLRNDERVINWVKSLQYCQGVLIVEAKLDLEQEKLVKLEDEELDRDQKVTLNVSRETVVYVPVHRYEEVVDNFSIFDADLKCYTYSGSLSGWLVRRLGMGERLMAKYVRVNTLDESFKKSMFDDQIDIENEVQFAGATTGAAFSHVANHMAAAHGVAHHAYLGGSWGAQTGIILSTSIVAAFIALWLMMCLALYCSGPLDNKPKNNNTTFIPIII